MAIMRKGPAAVVIAALVVVALVAGIVAALVSARPTPQRISEATSAPSVGQLQALADELSSGNRTRVLAAIADLPASEADSVWNSLRNLRAVDFNTSTVSFDPQTGSAVVQARLTPKKGKPTFEREVLVQRNGLWFLYTSLPGGSPT